MLYGDRDKKSNDLAALAQTIRTAHTEARRAANDFLTHALAAGDALLLARSKVSHGQWRRWLAENCDVSERSAQRYMRLAKACAANPTRVADFEACSMRGALQILENTERAIVTNRPDPFTRSENRVPLLSEIVTWWRNGTLIPHRELLTAMGRADVTRAIPPEWRAEMVRTWAENAERRAVRRAARRAPDIDYPRRLALLEH